MSLVRLRAATPRAGGRRRGGFTLVEMLVGVSVLASIVLLVSRLLGGLTATTSNASRLSEADDQARLIFSRMDRDFAAVCRRPDVHFYFLSQANNDAFYFYSEAEGHAPAGETGTGSSVRNGASLVGYRVNDAVSGGTRVELERLGQALHWVDAGSPASGQAQSVLFLPFLIKNAFSQALASPYNNSSSPAPSGSSPWDVIGDQVFRMEFCFLLQDGTFSAIPVEAGTAAKPNLAAASAPGASDDATAGYSPGSRWYDAQAQVGYRCVRSTAGAAAWIPLGLQDIKAVVVTLALLPAKARATMPASTLVQSLPLLTDFAGSSPVTSTWEKKAASPSSFRQAGFSAVAATDIRVYERFFYVN